MNIIVAGASTGIGRETVKKFASLENHKIIAISRTASKLESLAKECEQINPDASIIPFQFDLESGDYTDGLKSFVQSRLRRIDILVFNAGYLVNKPFEELNANDYDRMFNVNNKAAFLMIQSLLPLFTKDSHILTISSMGGYQGSSKFPGLSLYSASKGSLAVLTECLAEEFKDKGIKCNCLALGAVQTEMLGAAFPGYKAPLDPEQMADFLTDFAINGHKYFNGKILPVSLSTP